MSYLTKRMEAIFGDISKRDENLYDNVSSFLQNEF